MKTRIQIIMIGLLVLSQATMAKSQGGIYKTSGDFTSNKLTDEGSCKIRVHDFFYRMPTIAVISGGEKHTYKKNELYGFRNCNDEMFRFYKNTEYRIEEAGNIFIYTKERNIAQSKGYKVVKAYYFSTSADGDIMPLTIENLKGAYRTNEKFLELIDQFFNQGDVNEYDHVHKTFKLNYVYRKSMNL